jgi:hypothetical protein
MFILSYVSSILLSRTLSVGKVPRYSFKANAKRLDKRSRV